MTRRALAAAPSPGTHAYGPSSRTPDVIGASGRRPDLYYSVSVMFRSLPMPVLFAILALALLVFGPRVAGPWKRG